MDDGAYQLVLRRSDQLGCVRTAGQVRRERADGYRFLLPLDGELTLVQDGREARLRPGTGGLVTLAAPFRVGVAPGPGAVQGVRARDGAGRGRAFVMTIPAREMDRRLRRPSPVATGLDLSAGLGRVVADMVRAVGEERRALSAPQFDAACDRITELLCVIVAGRQGPAAAPGHLAEVEAVVRRYVREHATEPGLTGAAMAQDLGWSLRQVQLALQHAGTTPRELIREERLRLVRDRLRNPQDRDVTITDIAHATGFSSASALSTAFRRRFGVSPRELRHTAH
ncbi:AraC family transcriptional regulator [Actinomadura sp. NTSP31]|uniref:AraC family transcriptional regulator n=1 Tax=Actinomadura sp. NTSP31 TaxID=1735447 RepID=UPI0035C1F5E4